MLSFALRLKKNIVVVYSYTNLELSLKCAIFGNLFIKSQFDV